MTVILDIDHEAGNLNEWGSTSGKVSASADAALGGSDYGLLVDIDDTTIDYAAIYPGYNSSGIWRTRFYFNADDVSIPTGGIFTIFIAYNYSYGAHWYVSLQNNGGNHYLRMYYGVEGGVLPDNSYAISSGDHYVEVLYKQGNGDGEFKTWIDGVAKSNRTGLNNDNIVTYNGLYYVRAGDMTAPSGSSGDLYIDEIIINDTGDEIGPNSTDYILTCNAGSYSLTGTDANLILQKNYSLVCAAGSYTLTGADISFILQRNYILACNGGTYNLTGTAVDLILQRNYILACAAGSYALTGTDIDLVLQRNYSLSLDPGSYTLTGSDVNLILQRNYSLICSAGSYVLTGSDIDFILQRNYSLALDPGVYVLTGTDVNLIFGQTNNYTLVCDPGSYALTGADINFILQRNYILSLDPGSYVLTGTDVGLFLNLIRYAKIVSFTVQLNKIVSSTVQLNKVVSSPVQMNKSVSSPVQLNKVASSPVQMNKTIEMTAYLELEDSE
jgi:hypothetical protein